jgi:nitrite reductase/ring-hydroxylating ferredoxin subunit
MASADRIGVFDLSASKDVLRCPFHGYEYDVDDGTTIVPGPMRCRSYEVVIRQGEVFVVR